MALGKGQQVRWVFKGFLQRRQNVRHNHFKLNMSTSEIEVAQKYSTLLEHRPKDFTQSLHAGWSDDHVCVFIWYSNGL